jgi:uncharacterized repeat protein (TIGR01451 family)
MTTYEVGQTITRTIKVTNSAGSPANADSVTCTVTLPDGTTAPAEVGSPSPTGTYVTTLATTQAGRHRFRWSGSGANSGGFPYTDVVDVWPTDPRLVIGLDDARANINIPSIETADDDELRLFIASATEILEDLGKGLGIAILPTLRTEDHAPKTELLALHRFPVGSITSVTEYVGTAATVIAQLATPGGAGEGYTVDLTNGHLIRRSGGYRTPWEGEVRVVYTWGSSIIAPRVIHAARELVSHLWSVGQRGSHGGAFGSSDAYTITPAGYAVPNRVVEILDPTREGRVSGIA